ncbi:MAG: hypothetical protein CVT67_06335 [Actinobacteria bacterium HGW-Actinobacteria-7]|jgi:hypothetical protein|nr:MAG: hypothetical protein CVT67_06335 [Actinobacteria bacterium HGW-Actinobacteria-7]
MNPYLALAIGAVLGVGVPWLLVRMLVPSLEDGRKVRNFQGREVYLGLGTVWLVWAGCAIVGGVTFASQGGSMRPSVLPLLTLAGPLALVAFALGMVDDALGTSAARGFRGHLRALAKGRLTTGGLKLFGISLASLVVALVMSQISPWAGHHGANGRILNVGLALIAGAAIALTSNLVNLTDLRPGRALKTYSMLSLVGVVSTGLLMPTTSSAIAAGFSPAPGFERWVDVLVLGLFVLGPVFAVWRYDLAEMGMLGDGGANPMGAVAGLLVVAGLPLWGLLVYFAVMLAVNLASERISFSAVIDGNNFLRWLDSVGRRGPLPDEVLLKTDTHGEHNPE